MATPVYEPQQRQQLGLHKNEAGITRFWKEGLERNRNFENVITIVMRGENDSKLLSEQASMAENIAVLKHALSVQNRLNSETLQRDLREVPCMLAIYKEVEDYFLGDESCEGLKDWKELEDIIFLLADDNFGHLRALPPGPHPGGYGMYYHFDYHGAPVRYEWLNSSRLPKIWEQMCRAYESGVHDMWIVNAGDLKGVEYPLNFFMDLAHDFESWGSTNPDSAEEYSRFWIERQFGPRLSEGQKSEALAVLQGIARWNARRRPEAMTPDIYHPLHYNEAERVLQQVSLVITRADVPQTATLKAYGGVLHGMASWQANSTAWQVASGTT